MYGRFAHQHIERHTNALEQIALDELDARRDVQPPRVQPRDLERVARNIGGDNARCGQVMCQRHRQRARTCANVHNHRRVLLPRAFQRDLRERFGFIARNQHAAIYHKVQSIKFAMSDDVRQRLILGAPRHIRGIARGDVGRERFIQTRQHLRARRFERVREQQFGLQTRVTIRHRRAERARGVEERGFGG
jgi:hypothetical protein